MNSVEGFAKDDAVAEEDDGGRKVRGPELLDVMVQRVIFEDNGAQCQLCWFRSVVRQVVIASRYLRTGGVEETGLRHSKQTAMNVRSSLKLLASSWSSKLWGTNTPIKYSRHFGEEY